MILFIVNERSGNGGGKKAWTVVERRMRELGRSTDYIKIAAASVDDAVRNAEAHVDQGGIRSLVAIGGDGTLHALLPLAVHTGLPLGLIPCGSGNDTARAFGLSRNPLKALDIVLRGHVRRVDLLQSGNDDAPAIPGRGTEPSLTCIGTGLDGAASAPVITYSLTCIATGLDGAVASDVNNSRYKRWCNRLGIGSAAYIIGLLRTLAAFKSQTISVTVDGVTREFRRSWLAAIANTANYGGGLQICPSASPTDGRLQVCVVHGCSALQLLLLFPTVLFGKHIRSRFVTILTGSTVSIRSPQPLLAYGDGEQLGSTPLEASILANQLLILTSCSG